MISYLEEYDRIITETAALEDSKKTLKKEIIERMYYDTIDEAIDASDDALLRLVTGDLAASNHSIITTLLVNVKAYLLHLVEQVIIMFNQFMLNRRDRLFRYKDLIMDRYLKLKDPIYYEFYEYPYIKELPKDVRSSTKIDEIIDKIMKFVEENSPNEDQFESMINRVIREFGQEILGESVDPEHPKDSVEDICKDKMLGKVSRKQLTRKDLLDMIDNNAKWSEERKMITHTKSEITKCYKQMEKIYKKVFAEPTKLPTTLDAAINPQKNLIIARQANLTAFYNLQIKRMFRSILTIYRESFRLKLEYLHEKYMIQTRIISEVMVRCNITYQAMSDDDLKKIKRDNTLRLPDMKETMMV